MSEIIPKIKKLSSLGIPLLVKRLLDRSQSKSKDNEQRKLDLNQSTWNYENGALIPHHFLKLNDIRFNERQQSILSFHLEMYLDHRFDILGSSWLSANFNAASPGLCGISNTEICDGEDDRHNSTKFIENQLLKPHVPTAQRIYAEVLKTNPNYQPINWQREIKTGFHYEVKKWYKDNLALGKKSLGTDLKVARELSRFHQLPQLALIAHALPESSEKAVKEFICQTLDFIALNPPRMGVHWLTTMDVAIRAINMIIGYDLMAERITNKNFQQIFSDSIMEHGKHIFENLEDKSGLTNNHYFANIVGLITICAYLPSNRETNEWLRFGYEQLIKEFEKQFLEDGGNFEGSTTYHALGIEMSLLGTYFISQLNKEQLEVIGRTKKDLFPDWMMQRLDNGISLLSDLIKPNGNIVQFGDNDSGRILKLFPGGKFIEKEKLLGKHKSLEGYANFLPTKDQLWDENYLDYKSILALSNAVLGKTKDNLSTVNYYPELQLFRSNYTFDFSILQKQEKIRQNHKIHVQSLLHKKEHRIEFNKTIQLEEVSYKYYADVGYLIALSKDFHLAIKIGNQNNYVHSLGHCHNDLLSFELTIGKKEIIIDPGTFVYTPSRKLRDDFRSVAAHSTIQVENEEQNRWYNGVFWNFNLLNEVDTEIISIEKNQIIAQAKYRNIHHIRTFEITEKKLIIIDQCNHDFKQNWNSGEMATAGYGKLLSYPKKIQL